MAGSDRPHGHDSDERRPAGNADGQSATPPKMADYYRRLRRRLYVGILIAFMVPLAILSLYFHFQFNVNLKESGKQHLTTLAESQRNTIDLFLRSALLISSISFTAASSGCRPRRMIWDAICSTCSR